VKRAVAVALAAVSMWAAAPVAAADVPGTNCSPFPVENAWNMDVRGLPVQRKSAVWKRATHAGSTRLHPDFGPPAYGIPFDVVASSHDDISIDFTFADESDPGPYPFGPDIRIEGGSDRHAIMVDQDTCTTAPRWGRGSASGAGTTSAGSARRSRSSCAR
jgi:hypothetical protein